jgi:hypothetical protein
VGEKQYEFIPGIQTAVIPVRFSRGRDAIETSTERNLDRRPYFGDWGMVTGKKKNIKKKKNKQTTTQEHNLTAAARDLGTKPSSQLMVDEPQLCPIYGPRPVLLYLSTSRLVLGLSTLP